jgi:GNAT superfamily N-acetyltransferase
MRFEDHVDRLFELEHHVRPVNRCAVPAGSGFDVPRVTIYRQTDGYSLFIRDDLSCSIRRRIGEIDLGQAIAEPALIASILADDEPCERVFPRVAYVIYEIPAASGEAQVVERAGHWIIEVDGTAVSDAWTVSANRVCASVRVDTLREFRGRGYAAQVLASWTRATLEANLLPYYTHATDNLASRALARRIGASEFASGVKFH